MFHTVLTCVETQETVSLPALPLPGEHGVTGAVAEEPDGPRCTVWLLRVRGGGGLGRKWGGRKPRA